MELKALLFDFDGLILDTEVPYFEAWREIYQTYGQELSLEMYAACVGSDFGGFDPKQYLQTLIDTPIDWVEWDRKRDARVLSIIHASPPLPGVEALLKEAAREGVPCAVASSSPRSWVEPHLERFGLRKYFQLTRCVDDVVAPKPAPDLFLSAANGLEVSPQNALVLEDSLHGLNAAKAAGISCVAVPNGVTAHLEFEHAAAVLHDGLEGVELKHLREWHTANYETAHRLRS